MRHRDRDLALGEGSKELSELSRKGVQEMIDAVVAVLNALAVKYLDSATKFDLGVGPGGAISVLYTLDNGLRAEELRRKRLERGELEEDDLKPREL